MKKIEALVAERMVKPIQSALQNEGFDYGMCIYSVEGRGNRRRGEKDPESIRLLWGEVKYTAHLIPKVKLETVVHDDDAKDITDLIIKTVRETQKRLGKPMKHMGKIFVSDVDEAIKISTGEPDDSLTGTKGSGG